MKLRAGKNSILIRVMPHEKDLEERTKGGIIFPSFMRPLLFRIQHGTAISIGENMRFAEIGNTIFIHHNVMEEPDRLVDFDSVTGSEVWCVRNEIGNQEIFGVMRDGEIIPAEHYVVGKPEQKTDSNIFNTQENELFKKDYEQDTSRHYKMKVLYKNKIDTQINVDDTLLCRPVSNYEISFKQEKFWFVDLQNTRGILADEEKFKVLDKLKPKKEGDKIFDWTLINEPVCQ